LSVEGNDTTIWGSGEWLMFLSAQSMAVGTIMVRWVSKYSDPIMATGWVCYPQMNNQCILYLILCHMRQSSTIAIVSVASSLPFLGTILAADLVVYSTDAMYIPLVLLLLQSLLHVSDNINHAV